MSAKLCDAIQAVVSARLSPRSEMSENEDVAAMAQEAIMLATDIEAFRPHLTPVASPEPLWLHLRSHGRTPQ
ncbi:hypothetical protein [Chelativorans sp. Marseille-P2723]|uniref:hypothetical protein n=1 Tax=Chelativorans sp. Marseille-P2723 TaxID=2709133 RepID=UPI00156FDDFA|nr:hypothetical protein [Chelativorans sp. Marseille-P2723]